MVANSQEIKLKNAILKPRKNPLINLLETSPMIAKSTQIIDYCL